MPRNVLYIDDDEGLCALVQRALQREGIRVVTAGDGESGLKAMLGEEFDVIALDQNMPGLDGMQTLERIHRIPGHPPVILVTGAQDSRLVVAALKAGAFDYVVKDTQGEFIPLLKAAFHTAVDAMRLRRAKEAAEAEVRAARDRFEALAAERAVLLQEVNHRIGNSLQLIAALLHMQGNATQSADIKNALVDATSRVMAVAQVHRRLYTSDNVKSVSIDQYLEALVEDLRLSSDRGSLTELSVTADPLDTDPDRAVAIGVIVNELVTNAVKYAYPDDQKGPIRVILKRNDDGNALLIVEDEGVGFVQSAPAGTGLGQKIVRAMVDKLDATVAQHSSAAGTRSEIVFAVTKRAA